MKKIFIYILPLICLVLASCKPNLKKCTGIVTFINHDTLKMKAAGNEALFLLQRAEFDNGPISVNDSAEVTYLGPISEGHAVLVTFLIKKGRIIDIRKDTTKELVTKPATQQDKKNIEKYIQSEKRRLYAKNRK